MPLRRFLDVGIVHDTEGPTNRTQQIGFNSRLAHAQSPCGAEIWMPTVSTCESSLGDPPPPPHVLHAKLHALGAITFGVLPWYGMWGPVDPWFREVNEAIRVREPYFGGEEVPYCGVVISQNTRDFYGTALNRIGQYSETLYGLDSMLSQHHMQYAFLFDEDLEGGSLDAYRVIILANTACLSDRAAANLTEFVQKGGLLIAYFETSLYDEWGERRADFGLAKLLGITYQATREEGRFAYHPILLTDPSLSRGRVPACFMAPDVQVKAGSDVSVLAHFCVEGKIEAEIDASRPAITARKLGEGEAIYFCADIGTAYIRWPYRENADILVNLILRARPPYEVEAPSVVLSNAFLHRERGSLLVHLLNLPYASNRMTHTGQHAVVDELIPVRGIRLRLNEFEASQARLVVAGQSLSIERDPATGTLTVMLPELVDHEIVEFKLARPISPAASSR